MKINFPTIKLLGRPASYMLDPGHNSYSKHCSLKIEQTKLLCGDSKQMQLHIKNAKDRAALHEWKLFILKAY